MDFLGLHETILASRHLQAILANSAGIWFQTWRILLDVIFNAQAVKQLCFGGFHVYVYATFASKVRSRMCNSASASWDVILLFSVLAQTWSWALMGFNTGNSSLFLLNYFLVLGGILPPSFWVVAWFGGVSGGFVCVLKTWFESASGIWLQGFQLMTWGSFSSCEQGNMFRKCQ